MSAVEIIPAGAADNRRLLREYRKAIAGLGGGMTRVLELTAQILERRAWQDDADFMAEEEAHRVHRGPSRHNGETGVEARFVAGELGVTVKQAWRFISEAEIIGALGKSPRGDLLPVGQILRALEPVGRFGGDAVRETWGKAIELATTDGRERPTVADVRKARELVGTNDVKPVSGDDLAAEIQAKANKIIELVMWLRDKAGDDGRDKLESVIAWIERNK